MDKDRYTHLKVIYFFLDHPVYMVWKFSQSNSLHPEPGARKAYTDHKTGIML